MIVDTGDTKVKLVYYSKWLDEQWQFPGKKAPPQLGKQKSPPIIDNQRCMLKICYNIRIVKHFSSLALVTVVRVAEQKIVRLSDTYPTVQF